MARCRRAPTSSSGRGFAFVSFPLPAGERVASHRVAPSAPDGKLREPGERRSELQFWLREPLTPTLSPAGRGGARAAKAKCEKERGRCAKWKAANSTAAPGLPRALVAAARELAVLHQLLALRGHRRPDL